MARPLKYAECPSCRGVDPKSCAHQLIHARLDLKAQVTALAAKGITMSVRFSPALPSKENESHV